ncbi:uncharacterized protein LOC105440688 [Strongylocentrotus purpuratus]|uniref:Death domain-containing protein n=1 Tax=Strongylocentrotus purpuratus TaxID=7668 RepID=A0A7M7SVF2_STRPU|nr:uncharacterized protein LOC105440688 [Strongylocentrotus purpuratus]
MVTTGQSEVLEKATNKLKKLGVTDVYDVPPIGDILSYDKRLHWLDLLHGCLKKGDKGISADLLQLYSLPSFERLWNQGRKGVTEAQKRHGEDIREEEEAKKLLRGRITDLEQELNESRASRSSIVSENERLQDTMKVEQERREHSERAMMENEKRATQIMETYKQREMEFEKKLQSRDLRIENLQGTEEKAKRQVEQLETDNEEMMTKLVSKLLREDTLTKTLEEKERNETTLRQQVEELKKGREGDRAGAEKEKRSLAAELTNIVQEKERNETTLRQQVEELKKGREGDRARFEKEKRTIELSWKKEHAYKEGLLEQLKRETWKLRTKIQLESEIRSAEQKKKAETPQWSFIPWVGSGKQAQSGPSSFEDNSAGGLGSDTVQAGEEPPDDEFADILTKIADDLYDEAKIDSLAGQLGILHGDIQRALMTNMRFGRVTSDGTRHMLKQWRRGVSREDERIELTKALQAAKLVNLADLYLSGGLEEEQIDAEYDKEGVNGEQLSTRDEASLEEDQAKGQTDTQVLQDATASNNYTPRDGHTGDMASKTQEDLTDGSRSQHHDKSPESSRQNLDASEVTSGDVSSKEIHAGDDMTNVSSIKPADQSSVQKMQVLPEDLSEIAPLVSSGGKPDEETTILEEEDLVSQLVLIDPFPEKIMLLFLLKIIMDVPQRVLNL